MTRSEALVVVAVTLLAGCPKRGGKKKIDPVEHHDAGAISTPAPGDVASTELPPAQPLPAVPRGLPPLPDHRGVTAEAVALGELLFHDARLSSTGKLACATCHDPARGYAGEVQATAGGQVNLRRTPTLVNLAWVGELGWDGRYGSTDSFLGVHVRGQLGDDLVTALPRIASLPLYRAQFARAFAQLLADDDPSLSADDNATRRQTLSALDPVNAEVARRALGAFVLTRYAGDAPWDRAEAGARAPVAGAPADPLLAGYLLFAGKAQCGLCHTPPLYTDGQFHAVAAATNGDPGRGLVDKKKVGTYRTPTLRDAASRPRFFHTGDSRTLEEVVDAYVALASSENQGPKHYDPLVSKIRLSADERTELLVFVRALSAKRPSPPKPVLP